jgi:queuine tRNA-ribosyltransferase
MYEDLREESARAITGLDFPGYAIGGLSVGEDRTSMYGMIETVNGVLPADRPRYLMGVGSPGDFLEAVMRGVDMFDSVLPTRNARNGTVFTPEGRLVLKNSVHREDTRPIQANCPCFACQKFTRGYIRHLFKTREILGYRLATIHNLSYLLRFAESLRSAILEGRVVEFRERFLRGSDSSDPG